MQATFRQISFVIAFGATAGILAPFSTVTTRADEAACAAFAWPLQRELQRLTAPGLRSVESGGALRADDAAVLQLQPFADVAYPLPPERQPKQPAAFGGVVFAEAPPVPGLYQITLSAEAWIDVAQNGQRLKSVAFSGKQGCPGMRKSVRFELSAAPVTIQISGAAESRIAVAFGPAASK